MSMDAKGTFKFADADNVNMTLTLTMRVKDWRKLQEAVKASTFGSNDGWYLAHRLLADLLGQAEKDFWANVESEKTA